MLLDKYLLTTKEATLQYAVYPLFKFEIQPNHRAKNKIKIEVTRNFDPH